MNNDTMNINVQISLEILFSLLLEIYLEVGLLGYMIILFLIFQFTPIIFKAFSEKQNIPALCHISLASALESAVAQGAMVLFNEEYYLKISRCQVCSLILE